MIIRPFNAAYLLLLAFAAGAVVLLWALLRGRSERCRAAVLIALCAVNIIGFFVYKGFLSRDVQFLQASGLDRFNWFSELPLQLCNINMFLIPIGILTHRRSLLGFAFFVAPLGALMALVFPEAPFVGYSLWLPRMLGFYVTHILIIACGLSLVTLGFYRPDFRDIPGIAGTFLLLGIGALAVNFLLRHTVCPLANYFFVYGGDVDISILNLFWKWLPVPFLYEMPALLILVGYMALICLLFPRGISAAPGRSPRYKKQPVHMRQAVCLFERKKTAADADSAAVRGAGYGNRTRLSCLGSRCSTNELIPQVQLL